MKSLEYCYRVSISHVKIKALWGKYFNAATATPLVGEPDSTLREVMLLLEQTQVE
jgi:hypothetical protein